jgi:hypothetical protein
VTPGGRLQPLSRKRPSYRYFVVTLTVLSWALYAARPASAASDPYLQWWTMETAHFRVHYYKGLEPVAEKVAALAEGVNQRLADALGHDLTDVTHIILSDHTDDANGYADAFPYNAIHLWVTAPEDLSALGDYDDWQLELVTHEHTHVIHTDTAGGIPALVNRIAGKWWLPNRAQPKWILEGIAVLEESAHTTGGRLRSSIFDMYLRADVLEKRLVPLDQMSHFVRRWPQGNIWYLYGSRFLRWIADVYGESTLRAVIADYGQQVIPWSVNRSMRRATGHTYEELYAGWSDHLSAHYGEKMRKVEALGVREGRRLTQQAQIVGNPRFIPPAARKTCASELLYFRDDGHSRPGFYRLPLDGHRPSDGSGGELAIRAQGHGSASFAPDGRVVFNSVAIHRRVYALNELFLLPRGVDSPSGFEPERKRMTQGARAQDPDVSPDGTQIVFTENHRGTTTLMIARLSDEGELSGARALVPSARFEQAYTPRFSPDGQWVVYSAWTEGGYRDIRLVEVKSGRFFAITRDRAMDWQPSFSPDGSRIFFASDRVLGIPNVFAFDRADGKLWQVTNVRTGAFYPEVSPDGRSLVYAGYTSYGYDLYAIDLEPSRWREAPPYLNTRPEPPQYAPATITARHPYNPLPTLRPRSWRLDAGPGTFGTALAISTAASDAVGHHALAAALLLETERGDPQGAVAYAYQRLPFDLSISFRRSVAPVLYRPDRPLFTRQHLSLTTGISYSLPGEFQTNTFNFGYTLSRLDGMLPLPTPTDPDAMIGGEPVRGQLGSVRLGWSYSNAEAYLRSVSAERGFTLALSADVAAPPLASDYTLYIVSYAAAEYFPMPWGRHHTLALRQSSAISSGNYPFRGIFYTGGFIEAPVFRPFTLGEYQGPFVLRGYPAFSFAGSQYHLFNAEYRFPIFNLDRGLSTMPFFLHRVSGNVFADYGGAFNELDPDRWWTQFHLGVGAELWLDLTVGYVLAANMRVGHARGVADSAAALGGQTYVVLAAAF